LMAATAWNLKKMMEILKDKAKYFFSAHLYTSLFAGLSCPCNSVNRIRKERLISLRQYCFFYRS
jgi:hypothetical protein